MISSKVSDTIAENSRPLGTSAAALPAASCSPQMAGSPRPGRSAGTISADITTLTTSFAAIHQPEHNTAAKASQAHDSSPPAV
ncbi:MAG: hypothetical protein ACRDRG_03830 [Pseudonocardiaceae bacterium]